MNIEKMISDIHRADECEIMEFDFEPVYEALRQLQDRVDELEGAIATHNKECDFLCVNDKHCDHRPRQCASCPKDWKINI